MAAYSYCILLLRRSSTVPHIARRSQAFAYLGSVTTKSHAMLPITNKVSKKTFQKSTCASDVSQLTQPGAFALRRI